MNESFALCNSTCHPKRHILYYINLLPAAPDQDTYFINMNTAPNAHTPLSQSLLSQSKGSRSSRTSSRSSSSRGWNCCTVPSMSTFLSVVALCCAGFAQGFAPHVHLRPAVSVASSSSSSRLRAGAAGLVASAGSALIVQVRQARWLMYPGCVGSLTDLRSQSAAHTA
jgi:hypothetical protein